jgi:hypothetical protein
MGDVSIFDAVASALATPAATQAISEPRAVDSPVFWVVVGVLGFAILLIALKGFFHWYLGIGELKEGLEEIKALLASGASARPEPSRSSQAAQPAQTAGPSEEEVAAAIAAAVRIQRQQS